jgi:rubrerythrin
VASKRVRTTEVDEPADRKAVAFDPEMDFVAALRLAIQREEDSVRLYQMLGQEAEDPVQQKLFRLLVGQEQGHRARLQDELDSVVLRDY